MRWANRLLANFGRKMMETCYKFSNYFRKLIIVNPLKSVGFRNLLTIENIEEQTCTFLDQYPPFQLKSISNNSHFIFH